MAVDLSRLLTSMQIARSPHHIGSMRPSSSTGSLSTYNLPSPSADYSFLMPSPLRSPQGLVQLSWLTPSALHTRLSAGGSLLGGSNGTTPLRGTPLSELLLPFYASANESFRCAVLTAFTLILISMNEWGMGAHKCFVVLEYVTRNVQSAVIEGRV